MGEFKDLKPGDKVYCKGRWSQNEVVEPVEITFLRWRIPGEVGVFESKGWKQFIDGDIPTRALELSSILFSLVEALEDFKTLLGRANIYHVKEVASIQNRLRKVEAALEKARKLEGGGCDGGVTEGSDKRPDDDDGGTT